MTIQEAMRSNRPFQRKVRIYAWPPETNWFVATTNGELKCICLNTGHVSYFTVDDILADDWETKP